MNIRNTSRLPDHAVEVLIAFAKSYVDRVAKREITIREARVTHCRAAYSGRAFYSGHCVLLRIGPRERYPVKAQYARYKDFFEYDVRDPSEGLVMLAAHEFWHHARWQAPEARGAKLFAHHVKNMEHDCETVACDALDAFRKERAKIDAKIACMGIRISTRELSAVERERRWKEKQASPEHRIARATQLLRRWETKRRLAETKIKKLHRRISALQRSMHRHLAEAASVPPEGKS